MRITLALLAGLAGSLALLACTESVDLGGSTGELGGRDTWTICHRTLSETNPYVEITTSRQGAEHHLLNHTDPRDYAFKGEGSCGDGGGDTGGSPCVDDGKCRICEVGCPHDDDREEGNFCLPKLIIHCSEHGGGGGGGCECSDFTPQCCPGE
jgi:hypothetical protein